MYEALDHGRLDTVARRDLLISPWLPRFGGRLVLTVDVSPWLRPDTACSPDRLFSHVHGRSKSSTLIIPGRPCSFVAALTPDRMSWPQMLDAVRLGPADDTAAVTAACDRRTRLRLKPGVRLPTCPAANAYYRRERS